MLKRLTVISSVIAFGVLLGGCTKCGWLWDDWRTTPQTCREDAPRSPR